MNLCRQAIRRYENGIRDVNEDQEEYECTLPDAHHKLIYNIPKFEVDERQVPFIDRENDRFMVKTSNSEYAGRYSELDARSPHTSLALGATAAKRIS